MSILDRELQSDRPAPAKMAANRLVQITKQTYNQMVQAFNQGSQIFWKNGMGASPEDIASELSVNAKEVFELHYKLGQLIASIKPEAISEGLSVIGNFTLNDDGTVTIISPETPNE